MNSSFFKSYFEDLGYTFKSADALKSMYLFYKYYDIKTNKGVASILLEGDPGSGKTFLSEAFRKLLGENTEYLYTRCVEETNSDRLIATYNASPIVKGKANKAIVVDALTKAITLANEGKKVVLTIDYIDKAKEELDSYFLDFLQSRKIETLDNGILSLTEEGRKNIFTIFAKNNEREFSDTLLRRCFVIKMTENYELYENGINSTRSEFITHRFSKMPDNIKQQISNQLLDMYEKYIDEQNSISSICRSNVENKINNKEFTLKR